MHFGILGQLELSDEGRAIEIRGAKQRALLTVLLLRPNQVVSTDALIDALWEDNAPETAAKALQVHVSQLRKVLGGGRLQTKAPGYRLRIAPDELDLAVFGRLVEEGRLHEALALWRGIPLAEFARHRFARPEIARLLELRLGCLEDRVEHDLARGNHAELVGELEGLVRDNPHRERLRGQLMLALYRSGRQAEALDAYGDGRRALVEELGIEPGRSLRALHQAILNQDAALDLEIAEQSGPAEPAPPDGPAAQSVRKTVTALHVEIDVSASEDAALDPEVLRRVLGQVTEQIEAAVDQHGGTVEISTDETLLAVFGLPAAHEDDALRAVRAATEVRAALAGTADSLARERGIALCFRVGIVTGEVFSDTNLGLRARTTGEPLRHSSRLAHLGAAGEILFDDTTWRLVRNEAAAERAGDAWRLVRLADAGESGERRLASPMGGRERERRRLHDAFEQAAGDRSCQLFTVLGLAGVGKSRLVQEFLADIGERALVARGRCLPYGKGITYWPLLEAVKEVVGLDDTDSPSQAQSKLADAVRGVDQSHAATVATRVAELIGLAEVATAREEGFAAVLALFEALAEVAALVLVFDDIHWAEPTFLDLVEHLADWSRDAPMLLVCLARPELLDLRPGWGGGKLNATVTLLEPLSDDQCSLLIENMVGEGALADELGTRIAEAAEGNPLFVEEMLSMTVDDGLLAHEHGRWVAAGDISSIRVPPTIQALLAARLDQLGSAERLVIERAAVTGKVFQEGAVAELVPDDARPGVGDALAALVRKELVRPERTSLGERTFRFRHLLIRDAAYESLSKEARAQLHERFARWLDRTARKRSTEYEEVVGYHLEQAYRYRAELGPIDGGADAVAKEAALRLGNAGRRAFTRSDAPAGTNLVSRAVALLRPDDPLRVELVPNVRVVSGMGKEMEWADRVLTEAVEAAATSGDRRLAAHALVQRGLLRLFTEHEVAPEELIGTAERSLAVFAEHADELGMARAFRLTAQAHYLGRRAEASAHASEQALEHVRRVDDRFEEREIIEWLLIALLLGPTPAPEAESRCRELLQEFADRPLLQVEILASLAPLVAMQRRSAEAAELVRRCRSIMDEIGERIWIAAFWCAFVSHWAGDARAAEQELRPSYDALKRMGEKSHFSSIAHGLSTAAYMQARYDEAEQFTRECEEASRTNDIHSRIIWRSTRAKVMARRGRFGEAERLAAEALAIAAESDFHPAHADALMDLAEVRRLAGSELDAAAATEKAIQLYESKGNFLAADRARGAPASRAEERP